MPDFIHSAHLQEYDTIDLSNLCKHTHYTPDIDRIYAVFCCVVRFDNSNLAPSGAKQVYCSSRHYSYSEYCGSLIVQYKTAR